MGGVHSGSFVQIGKPFGCLRPKSVLQCGSARRADRRGLGSGPLTPGVSRGSRGAGSLHRGYFRIALTWNSQSVVTLCLKDSREGGWLAGCVVSLQTGLGMRVPLHSAARRWRWGCSSSEAWSLERLSSGAPAGGPGRASPRALLARLAGPRCAGTGQTPWGRVGKDLVGCRDT